MALECNPPPHKKKKGITTIPLANLGILTEAHTQYQQKTGRKPLRRETIEVGLLQQRLHICLGSFRRFLLHSQKWGVPSFNICTSSLSMYLQIILPLFVHVFLKLTC